MPTYTVTGLVDDRTGELYVAAVFEGKVRAADRFKTSGVAGRELERFLGYFDADDAIHAEAIACELIGYSYDGEPDVHSPVRHVTIVKTQEGIL